MAICSFEAVFYHFCSRAFEKIKLPSWVFLLPPNSAGDRELSLALPETSISHWLGSSLLQVSLLFPVWDNYMCELEKNHLKCFFPKLVTLDALQSKHNMSETISEAPFALILMAVCH